MPALIALTLVMLPMTGEFGWTRTQFSFGMSAIMWLSACSGPVLGRLVDRWGVRLVVLSGPAVLGLAMLALSRTHHLWQFCLYYSLLGIFAPATAIGYGKVIAVTFTRNRGKAFAVLMALLSMATSVIPLIGNLLLTRMGWRGVFFGFGLLILGSAVGLSFIVEEPGRQKPADVSVEAGAPATAPLAHKGHSAAQAEKDPVFWALVVTGMATTGLAQGWTQHQLAFLLDRGFTQRQIVNLLSLTMFASPLGAVLGGWLSDRVQTAKIAVPFALLTVLGFLGQSVVWAHRGGIPLLFVSMFLGLIGPVALLPMTQYFYSRYFGMKAFAELFGLHMSLQCVLVGFSSPLIGWLFGRTGSYNAALLLMAAASVVSAVLFLCMGRYRYSVEVKPVPQADGEKCAAAVAG